MTKRFWVPHQKDCVHKIHREATNFLCLLFVSKRSEDFEMVGRLVGGPR